MSQFITHIDNDTQVAADFLKNGHVVAIPTETVYGLAADIYSEPAISKIFTLKNRPHNHPLIVHIADISQLDELAINIPYNEVKALASAFWPGPLTILLKKNSVPDNVTGGHSSVAIRMPAHPSTLKVIRLLNHPIAAPSANSFGKISPTTPEHVFQEFSGKLPFILDGGRCEIGIESTILDLRDPQNVTILRQGLLTESMINQSLNYPLVKDINLKTSSSTPVSGNLNSHYAPNKPLFLFDTLEELFQLISKYKDLGQPYILKYKSHQNLSNFEYQMPRDFKSYAYQLYFQLRLADHSLANWIAIEAVPNQEQWQGVTDRLSKASYNSSSK